MNRFNFATMEGYTLLSHGIIHESWFITTPRFRLPLRRELYKMPDGSVVALRDSGVTLDNSLYMDETFVDFYRNEPEMEVILKDQGIANIDLVKTFRME